VSVQLCDHRQTTLSSTTHPRFLVVTRKCRQGDGGFCIVRGSHKLNLPVPDNVAHGMVDAFQEHLYQPVTPKVSAGFQNCFDICDNRYQPVTQAGDVVIWSEATVHGATPWKADHQRRIALYRFSPANMGYGRGYLEIDPARLEGMTDAQRAVLQPPYATRLERPVVAVVGSGDVQVQIRQRSEEKKQLDMELFGTKYF
jgi:ectoine hydroxylase-related dioxygenase (phytanoyl-CoA dioxygenase family)